MHTGFLLINGEKMSKSLGNFTTIRDFLEKNSAETLRMIVTAHHYRSPIDYTDALAHQAVASLQRVRHFIARLNMKRKTGKISENINTILETAEKGFTGAMEDDFNTPDALASLFNMINSLESGLWNLNKAEAGAVRKLLEEKFGIFGILLKKTEKIPSEITKKAKEREEFRIHKQFIQSDAIRKELDALGYIIEDTPLGPLVLKK